MSNLNDKTTQIIEQLALLARSKGATITVTTAAIAGATGDNSEAWVDHHAYFGLDVAPLPEGMDPKSKEATSRPSVVKEDGGVRAKFWGDKPRSKNLFINIRRRVDDLISARVITDVPATRAEIQRFVLAEAPELVTTIAAGVGFFLYHGVPQHIMEDIRNHQIKTRDYYGFFSLGKVAQEWVKSPEVAKAYRVWSVLNCPHDYGGSERKHTRMSSLSHLGWWCCAGSDLEAVGIEGDEAFADIRTLLVKVGLTPTTFRTIGDLSDASSSDEPRKRIRLERWKSWKEVPGPIGRVTWRHTLTREPTKMEWQALEWIEGEDSYPGRWWWREVASQEEALAVHTKAVEKWERMRG